MMQKKLCRDVEHLEGILETEDEKVRHQEDRRFIEDQKGVNRESM